MLVTSRSFEEYVAFFDLDPNRLPPRIVDCCAGASGFVARAHASGVNAVAVDPAYAHDASALTDLADSGATGGAAMIAGNADRFTYCWYGTPQRRAEMRRDALARFVEHRRAHPQRYVAADLPHLPLPDGSFDLALCSHLLFTWAGDFDEQWHLAALRELCRVATDVRVFPLVLAGTGEPVEFLPRLRERLRREHGITSSLVTVRYEFQVGANQMLRLAV